MRSNQVTDQYPQCSRCEQRLICKTELHAEQQGEVDSHTCEIGVHTHQYILTHQRHSPDHLVQCSQIHPARKLESNGNEQINPRLYLPRYEATEHRHHERAI